MIQWHGSIKCRIKNASYVQTNFCCITHFRFTHPQPNQRNCICENYGRTYVSKAMMTIAATVIRRCILPLFRLRKKSVTERINGYI